MLETHGDLFEFHDQGHWVCITINGTLKTKIPPRLVMGAGCAGVAEERFEHLALDWGDNVVEHGNVLHIDEDRRLIQFPVKHNWWEKADLDLILRSCDDLMTAVHDSQIEPPIYLPRPGCGLGRLDWETQVKPAISPILNDRVTVISFQ